MRVCRLVQWFLNSVHLTHLWSVLIQTDLQIKWHRCKSQRCKYQQRRWIKEAKSLTREDWYKSMNSKLVLNQNAGFSYIWTFKFTRVLRHGRQDSGFIVLTLPLWLCLNSWWDGRGQPLNGNKPVQPQFLLSGYPWKRRDTREPGYSWTNCK